MWNLSFRGYSSSTWSNLLALAAKYLKKLQVFEDTTNSCDRMSTCIIVQPAAAATAAALAAATPGAAAIHAAATPST